MNDEMVTLEMWFMEKMGVSKLEAICLVKSVKHQVRNEIEWKVIVEDNVKNGFYFNVDMTQEKFDEIYRIVGHKADMVKDLFWGGRLKMAQIYSYN